MTKTTRDCLFLAAVTVLITLLVWLPHILALSDFWGLSFKEGFSTIYRNFDGIEYIIIAKSFYQNSLMAQIPQSLPGIYFASHFPGYSILILLFAPIFGFLKSMLFIAILSTIASAIAFYFLVKDFKLTDHPLFLSVVFLILPARWLIVHSVGSSEGLFIFLIILSIYFFMKYELTQNIKFILLTALTAAAAQITRPPGILLFIALVFYIHIRMFKQIKPQGFLKPMLNHLKYWPLVLIPVSLVGIFYLYQQNLGDFWAYFHSGDNIHLTFPPFAVFNKHQFWVGDIWLEDIVYIFILGFLGAATLYKKKLYPIFAFVLTYLIASTLIVHRDIARYTLPVAPFILIAFEKVLTSKEFKIILPVILIAIYLYAQNFLLANVSPIPNPQLFN